MRALELRARRPECFGGAAATSRVDAGAGRLRLHARRTTSRVVVGVRAVAEAAAARGFGGDWHDVLEGHGAEHRIALLERR